MYAIGVVFAAKLILYYFFVGNKFIVAAVSSIKSRAGSYSLGIFPSSMASLIADKISPTGRDGGNPKVSMISSPRIGSFILRMLSFSSISRSLVRTNSKLSRNRFTFSLFGGNIRFAKKHQIVYVIAGIEQESSYGRVGNDFFGEDDRSHVQSYEFLYVFHLLIEW